MKTASFILILSLMCAAGGLAQHIPPCGGSSHSSGTICWGYATARAFNRTWSDSRCPAGTLYLTTVNTTYFDELPFNINDIRGGDIVKFGNNEHVSYVVSVNLSNMVPSQISMAQVENAGGSEQLRTLEQVINGSTNPSTVSRG